MKNATLIRLALIILFCDCYPGTKAQSVAGVLNSYYPITAINFATNSLTVSNATGLGPGIKVLIIQMKGAAIDNSNTSSFGDITNIGDAGNYEFNYICAVAGNEVLLQYEFARTYNATGSIQLVTIPEYNIVTVTDSVKAKPWDAVSGTGGIVVFEADTVFLNSGINVSGQGFAGGSFVNFTLPDYDCVWSTNVDDYFLQLSPVPDKYYSGGPKGEGIAGFIMNAEYGRGKQASGGGGGNNHNTGGAGGANYGAGGHGGMRTNESFFLCHGTNPGIGGLSVSSFGYSIGTNRIYMGGGGGSGHQNNTKGMPGGNGGGIVIITANVINGNGNSILADGLSPVNVTNIDPYTAEGDGGGGGGAGGTIILNVTEVIGTIISTVTGAKGSDASRGVNDCTGPGGGGGGGTVWMKGVTFSPQVMVSVAGGSNGVVSSFSGIAACRGQANGATPGNNGSAMAGYLPPAMTNFTCASLASPEIKFFRGKAEQKNIKLYWSMNSIHNIAFYEVESAADQVNYRTIARIINPFDYSLSLYDSTSLAGTIYYRLKLIRNNGSSGYSQLISITKQAHAILEWVSVTPNPANHQLNVLLLAKKRMAVQLIIFNTSGQNVSWNQYHLSGSYNRLSIDVTHLVPGMYWLMLEGNGMVERRRFIKLK